MRKEETTPLYCGTFGFHKMNEGDYAESSAADVINRMKKTANCTNIYELALYLKTSQPNITDAKRRNIIPIVWLRVFMEQYPETSPLWLLTGRVDEAWNKGLRLCGGYPGDYEGPIQ